MTMHVVEYNYLFEEEQESTLSSFYYDSDPSSVVRLLNETDSDNSTATKCEDLAGSNDARVLAATLRLYGSLFVVILICFCFLRRRYPKIYNLRNSVPELKTELAEDARGSIAWMWHLFGISDKEMMDECGMDALCYTRVLEFGLKLSLVGILNAVWLIPVYATAGSSELTDCIKDPIVMISVAHLPSGSYRFCATVVAAYVIFSFTMYTILQEFEWFSRFRHQFLSKTLARNYCVYIQCIPKEYRSNAKLLEFFEQASSKDAVLDAHLAIKIPNLQKQVAEREALVTKLEHAINLEEIRGVTPIQRTTGMVEQAQSMIDVGFAELQELNQSISEGIDRIERKANGQPPTIPEGQEQQTSSRDGSLTLDYPPMVMALGSYGAYGDDQSNVSAMTMTIDKTAGDNDDSVSASDRVANKWMSSSDQRGSQKEAEPEKASGPTASLLKSGKSGLVSTFKTAANAAGSVANVAANLLKNEDGVFHSAGFVTFRSLRSAQAALQMIQYPEAFAMDVLEAPQPEDVNWKNVGKTHKELQLGKLFSFALTTTLCLLWTIPMGFISTLSSVEGLRGEFSFIDDLFNDFPWLVPIFEQLAPLLIVVANEVLKMVLELLSGLEGPISGAVVQAKLFSKLSSFMIIQTFFVTAIGGSIISELSAIAANPGSIIDLLAKSLPTQSTFFIQILLVDTFLSMGIELLRVTPIAIAAVRGCVGPRLTVKERSTTWMGLRPLTDPVEFEHANLLSGTVLYFMVFFVYATLAPITTVFMFLCFLLMAVGYRHQLVYIYPTFPDSGGKLWSAFLRVCPICMIIAQVTIVGMLALNKAAAASAMMFPLLVVTVLFTIYIHQKHFAMTEHLPAREAMAVDLKNREERQGEMDFEFVKNRYIQPELREREVLPENATVEREIEQGCLEFTTPPGSHNGDYHPKYDTEDDDDKR